MRSIVWARRSRASLAIAATVAVGAACTLVASAAGAARQPKGPVRDVTVRVEGAQRTLLAPRTVTLRAGAVGKKAGETCSALSALGALDRATRGRWDGSWSASYSEYFVSSILGSSYGAEAHYYWAFWIDDKPAPVGACDYDPAKGTSLLFFPQYDGKSKSVVAPAVLGISAPASVATGRRFTLLVTSYANANGKARPAAGVHVEIGKASRTTNAAGKVSLALSRPGRVELRASARDSVRDETALCVHAPGASCSG
jgi:Domain of unknown function (DUF4430)